MLVLDGPDGCKNLVCASECFLMGRVKLCNCRPLDQNTLKLGIIWTIMRCHSYFHNFVHVMMLRSIILLRTALYSISEPVASVAVQCATLHCTALHVTALSLLSYTYTLDRCEPPPLNRVCRSSHSASSERYRTTFPAHFSRLL